MSDPIIIETVEEPEPQVPDTTVVVVDQPDDTNDNTQNDLALGMTLGALAAEVSNLSQRLDTLAAHVEQLNETVAAVDTTAMDALDVALGATDQAEQVGEDISAAAEATLDEDGEVNEDKEHEMLQDLADNPPGKTHFWFRSRDEILGKD